MTADSSYHPKVLIVDDEKNIRRTLRMVLSSKEYSVCVWRWVNMGRNPCYTGPAAARSAANGLC